MTSTELIFKLVNVTKEEADNALSAYKAEHGEPSDALKAIFEMADKLRAKE